MGTFTAATRKLGAKRRLQNAIDRADEKYPTKRDAYRAGYNVGYTRAFRAWKARMNSVLQRTTIRYDVRPPGAAPWKP